MVMETEIKATIVAGVDKNSFNDGIKYARDTGKVLDKELKAKLELDVAGFQIQLEQTKQKLKAAKKINDQQAIIKAQLDTNRLQSGLTEAKRQLNNYVNTGDKDLSRLQSKFNQTNQAIEKQGGMFGNLVGRAKSSFSAIGGYIAGAFAITKITQFFTSIVDEAKAGERSIAQMNATIKSTGGTVGYTGKQIKDMASELSTLTGIEDDVIMASQNMLLTFTNIKGDMFKGATTAVIDLATAMNGGLTPSAEELAKTSIQVGKSLNDPIKGVTALRKVGVAFTETQMEQIKNFVKGGEVAKAQQIILAELNKEFGGSAAAQLGTYGGKVQALNTQRSNFKETLGNLVLPVLTLVLEGLSKLIGVASKITDIFGGATQETVGLNAELAKLKTNTDEIGNVKEETLEKINKLNNLFLQGKIDIEEYTNKSKALNGQMATLSQEESKLSEQQDKLNFLQETGTTVSENYVKEQKRVSESNKELFGRQVDLQKAYDKGQISQAQYTKGMQDAKKEIDNNNNGLKALGKQQQTTTLLTNILANSTLSAKDAKALFNKLQTNTGKSREELLAEQKQVRALSLEYVKNLQVKQAALATKAKRGSVLDEIFGGNKAEKALAEMEVINKEIQAIQQLVSKPISLDLQSTGGSLKAPVDDMGEKTKGVTQSANEMKKAFEEAFTSIGKDIDTSNDKIKTLKGEIETLSGSLEGLNKNIASRVADIDAELAKTGDGAVSSEERAKLEKERAEAFVGLTTAETTALQLKIDKQKEYDALSEIGKLKADFEEETGFTPEKAAIEIETKRVNLLAEEAYNKSLVDAKTKMDADYTAKYKANIASQITSNNALITSYQLVAAAAREAASAMASAGGGGGGGSSIPGRAVGGPVAAGSPYIVGEKGPELFVPQNSGNIVPNNQLTNNINISANVSNNIELDYLANQLAKKIALSRKGIF